MIYLVTASEDRGHFVMVEVDPPSPAEAAEKGAEEILAEWGSDYECGSCLSGTHLSSVFVWPVTSGPVEFEAVRGYERKPVDETA